MSRLREYLMWLRDLERQILQIRGRIWHEHPHHAHNSLITIFIHPFKFSSSMDGQLTVPTGTPVTGGCRPLDAKGNILLLTAYLAGSLVWSVQAPADGTPAPFTVAPGATEDKFAVTELAVGTASTGVVLLDAKDADGNQLPQSSYQITFTPVVPVAVASQIYVDQTSHA